jgi:hypothetical protein
MRAAENSRKKSKETALRLRTEPSDCKQPGAYCQAQGRVQQRIPFGERRSLPAFEQAKPLEVAHCPKEKYGR